MRQEMHQAGSDPANEGLLGSRALACIAIWPRRVRWSLDSDFIQRDQPLRARPGGDGNGPRGAWAQGLILLEERALDDIFTVCTRVS
jgi:hypothetical protein